MSERFCSANLSTCPNKLQAEASSDPSEDSSYVLQPLSGSSSTPMSAARSNHSFSEVPQQPGPLEETPNNWIQLMQHYATQYYNAEPLSASFINQLEYLIWEQRIVDGTPRLMDILSYPYNFVFFEPSVQEARLQEAMARHRATGLSWSALFQRIEYLCRLGFAELYCNTRQVTTLQVATFEEAVEIIQTPDSSMQKPLLDAESPFTIRQFNCRLFQEALKSVGVYQGEGALRTFILAYSTVAYHFISGIIEPIPQSTEELTRRLRRTFRLTPGRGPLNVLHKGSLPQSEREASTRYEQAQRRSKNRQQGQLRSQISQSKSPKSDDGQSLLGEDVSSYSFGSSMTSQEDNHDIFLPGVHKSAPEKGHLRFPASGCSAEFSMDVPRIPGSLSTPESECDTTSGSYLLQRSPSRPPQPLSQYLVSGSDAGAYEASQGANRGYAHRRFNSDPLSSPSNASQSQPCMSSPPGYSEQRSISLYGSSQYRGSMNSNSFMDYEHDTAAFMASLPSRDPQRYYPGEQNY